MLSLAAHTGWLCWPPGSPFGVGRNGTVSCMIWPSYVSSGEPPACLALPCGVPENDSWVDSCQHLAAGYRKNFKLGGTMQMFSKTFWCCLPVYFLHFVNYYLILYIVVLGLFCKVKTFFAQIFCRWYLCLGQMVKWKNLTLIIYLLHNFTKSKKYFF